MKPQSGDKHAYLVDGELIRSASDIMDDADYRAERWEQDHGFDPDAESDPEERDANPLFNKGFRTVRPDISRFGYREARMTPEQNKEIQERLTRFGLNRRCLQHGSAHPDMLCPAWTNINAAVERVQWLQQQRDDMLAHVDDMADEIGALTSEGIDLRHKLWRQDVVSGISFAAGCLFAVVIVLAVGGLK